MREAMTAVSTSAGFIRTRPIMSAPTTMMAADNADSGSTQR